MTKIIFTYSAGSMKHRQLLFSIFFLFLYHCAAAQVQSRLVNNGQLMEITNGLLGIGIPTADSYTGNQAATLAPIQYFLYADGTKSDDTPNFLALVYTRGGGSGPLSLKVTWLKKTAEEHTVRIEYTFNKYDFNFYDKHYPQGEAGPGYYRSTISVKKGEKSILVLEEYDYELTYTVQVSKGLDPTHARYRGWNASALDKGYEKPGVLYRPEVTRGYPMDATVDLPRDKPYKLPYLSYWNPLGGEQNTGRYWILFNQQAAERSNLFGIFSGRPSQLIGGRSWGIFFSSPETPPGAQKKVNLNVLIDRRGPDNSWYPKKRFEWGVFISTKKDLYAAEKTQPIFLEMNKKGGLAQKIDQYADNKAELNRNFFQAAIFSDAATIQNLIKKVKTDEAFYNNLVRSEGFYKPVLDIWRGKDSATSTINSLIRFKRELRENYKTGEGIFREEYRYWKGANVFKLKAIIIACLFADKDIVMTPDQKSELISLVTMMARIVWDNDNVPFFDEAGVNFGTANMPSMYLNTRYFFAMLFAGDKEFAARAKKVSADVQVLIEEYIRTNGSASGTPHYIQPSIDPLLFTILQLKNSGVEDYFKKSPLILKFADFYSSLLTPPSVRFLLNRKLVSLGDGSEESAVTFALLASGFADINPKLSRQLYDIYAHGPQRMSPFGPTFLAADLSNPTAAPYPFGSSNYTGYMSHFRTGANTEKETAVWFLQGESYRDHRTDDAGEVSIYALKAPLSLSRSSFYNPHATDARIRSMVIPNVLFPEWDQKNQPIGERSLQNRTWPMSAHVEFAKLGYMQSAEGIFTRGDTAWKRKIILSAKRPEKPVIILIDSLRNSGQNIWSMNFMSEGPVQTPAGAVTPLTRIHNDRDKKELPAATTVMPMPAGLAKFTFTGQLWNPLYHPSSGIDWDVYSISANPAQFTLSQWTTTWQNSVEAFEFSKANGRTYSEGQQILRIKGGSEFFMVILPYNKGEKYQNPLARIAEGVYLLQDGNDSVLITRTGLWSKDNESITAGAWGKEAFISSGYAISGGPAEMEIKGSTISIRIHGNSGMRKFRVPITGISSPDPGQIKVVTQKGFSEWSINYAGSGKDLLSTERGYKEYLFTIKK